MIAIAIAAGAAALLIVVSALYRHDRTHPVASPPQPSHVRVIPAERAAQPEPMRGAA